MVVVDIEFSAAIGAGVGARATAKAAAAAVAQVVEALLLLGLFAIPRELKVGIVDRVARWVPGLAPMNFYWN